MANPDEALSVPQHFVKVLLTALADLRQKTSEIEKSQDEFRSLGEELREWMTNDEEIRSEHSQALADLRQKTSEIEKSQAEFRSLGEEIRERITNDEKIQSEHSRALADLRQRFKASEKLQKLVENEHQAFDQPSTKYALTNKSLQIFETQIQDEICLIKATLDELRANFTRNEQQLGLLHKDNQTFLRESSHTQLQHEKLFSENLTTFQLFKKKIGKKLSKVRTNEYKFSQAILDLKEKTSNADQSQTELRLLVEELRERITNGEKTRSEHSKALADLRQMNSYIYKHQEKVKADTALNKQSFLELSRQFQETVEKSLNFSQSATLDY